MNTVKEIKNNPHCLASITVRVKGRNNIPANQSPKVHNPKSKTQVNSC